MIFKSISTIIQDIDADMNTLNFAIEAARIWDAHLHVLCVAVDTNDPGFYYAGAQAIAVQENLERAQDLVTDLEEKTCVRLSVEEVAWDVEAVTLMSNGLAPFLAGQMRYFDLAILPLPYGVNRTNSDADAFEACVFGADIPIIVVPETADMVHPPKRVMIAWDNSSEALASARAAVPVVAEAEATEICVVAPPVYGPERSDPGGMLAQLLVRHGARVEVAVIAQLRSNVVEQLLQRATETGAEMIVMGAYGHSRLREAVLGGVTRSMLRTATIPVFMAR